MKITQRYAQQGMVSSGHPIATQEGIDVLKEGGNAFDATLCVATLLNVFLPMSCGLGGDYVMLGYCAKQKNVFQLAGLGKIPQLATAENFKKAGLKEIPQDGIYSMTSPATIDSYFDLLQLSTLSFERLLSPAIHYAEHGFIVNDQFMRWIHNNLTIVRKSKMLSGMYLNKYQKPKPVGEVIKQPALANMFKMLLEFKDLPRVKEYIAHKLDHTSATQGGFLRYNDIIKKQSEISIPISLRLKGYDIYSSSLPTQGYLLLQNLYLFNKAVNEHRIETEADKIHILSEIFNQTYWLRLNKAGDPKFIPNLDSLIEPIFLDKVYQKINFSSPTECLYTNHYCEGDTTYFNVVDNVGNAASSIQSLSLGFGSGIIDETTGIVISSRLGRSCSLNSKFPNCCHPGRKPINTIFPYIILKDNQLYAIGGTPGGDGQAQWNTAFLASLLLDESDLYTAISKPRWTYFPGSDKIENDCAPSIHVDYITEDSVTQSLENKGHKIIKKRKVLGSIRVIKKTQKCYVGIDDGREDGLTLGY